MEKQLTTSEKQAIKHIMSQAGWDVMLLYMDRMVTKYNAQPVKADTEFETIWRTAQREARGDALTTFFNTLEEEVSK